MTKETICVNCMEDTGGAQICPHCGFNRQEPQKPHALPYRTVLQGRYLVGRAMEENGEGIRYTGMDLTENTRVLIREFFPETLAQRAENGTDAQVMGGSEVLFNETIAQFLSDSRELAHRRELSAVFPVYDIFEENGTAYTVLEGINGVTLRSFIEESGGRLSWETARPLFMPVLNALSQLHAAGLSHLGISPDTLYVVEGGQNEAGRFLHSCGTPHGRRFAAGFSGGLRGAGTVCGRLPLGTIRISIRICRHAVFRPDGHAAQRLLAAAG